jgi:DNA-binding transcriptional MocR family regulator
LYLFIKICIDTINVNNYIVTMTMWTPDLKGQTPRYRAIADCIASDIQTGKLKPGDRLPTHRDLADELKVTIGTVTRGYAEAERRGLTHAVVGRGTFVRDLQQSQDPWPSAGENASGLIDLSISLPVSLPEEGRLVAEGLREIAADGDLGWLMRYQQASATAPQKQVFANWLEQLGLNIEPEKLLVTSGSQHGLNVVLSSAFVRGQVILAGSLVYPSLKSIAKTCGIELRSVAMDAEGLIPEALREASQQTPQPHGLYIDPTMQNPTSAIMSPERRQVISEIAEAHDLLVIEDDIHGLLVPEAQLSIAALIPDRTFYLTSVSKCVAPGLRTGFLLGPTLWYDRLLSGIHASMWMPAPLMAELTSRWIRNGTADRLIKAKREEAGRRQKIAGKILQDIPMQRHPQGYQIWLELPEPWATDAFVSEARERGIKLIGSSAFALHRSYAPHAVRITLGTPTRQELERGLKTLKLLLNQHRVAAY